MASRMKLNHLMWRSLFRVFIVALPLAVMDGVNYRRQALTLAAGDGIVLYTDGVTEATDRVQSLYGEDRLAGALRGLLGGNAGSVIDGIVGDVDAFASGVEQADDITLLAFKLLAFNK